MATIELNNGVKIPNVGIGTYLISPEDAEVSVREALKMGYRLIDTANAYRNERAVGRGIKASGVPREEIFLSTKLWITEYENPNAVDQTLERLGLDYIDLLFIHQPGGNYLAGYKQLEKAYKEGKIKSIGISNFEGKYIEEILAKCEIKPQVIQVECHPYYVQEDLRKVIDPENIKLMSWFPLGQGDKNLINEPVFAELGKKYNKTPAQIILKWHTAMGFIVIPGSKNVDHIRDNFNLFDFDLTKEDMDNIAKVNKQKRYYTRTDEMLAQFASWAPTYETE
jgi:diketogulonate reductase-like aldo/keto reductase